MKLVPYHGVLVKEHLGEIFEFWQVSGSTSSMKVFTTNFNAKNIRNAYVLFALICAVEG